MALGGMERFAAVRATMLAQQAQFQARDARARGARARYLRARG